MVTYTPGTEVRVKYTAGTEVRVKYTVGTEVRVKCTACKEVTEDVMVSETEKTDSELLYLIYK